MSKKNLEMVDLEARIRSDADGSLRNQLCQDFDNELIGLQRQMDAGLAPDDFERANKLKMAIQTAKSVVDVFWQTSQKAQ